MKRGISPYFAFLFFFFPLVSFSQDEAIKLAEGVYAIKGPGAAMNTGFVVGAESNPRDAGRGEIRG